MPEMASPTAAVTARTRWHYLLVGAVAAVLVLWRLGQEGLDEHEAKLAVPARNMFRQTEWLVPGVNQNGWPYLLPEPTPARYWLVPIANGRPRLVKTPLGYWAAAAVACLVGHADQWTSRLPSAVAAVLVVLVTLALGRRMFSARAALLGAIMLATSVGLVKYGRNARPEMLLCLFCTAAMAAFYLGLEATSRARRVLWMSAFWPLMGLASLAKQLVPFLLAWPLAAYLGWRQTTADDDGDRSQRTLRTFLLLSAAGLMVDVLITNLPALGWWPGPGIAAGKGAYVLMAACLGLPLLWYLGRARAWRQLTPLLPTAIPGVIVMGLMFVPWMWYMAHLFGGFAGSVFSYEVDVQALGLGLLRPDAPWFYVPFLLMLTAPWAGFLPGGLAAVFVKRFHNERPALVYLFLWSLGLLLLFTASVAKRKHYILPLLPAICLSMGFVAEDVCWRHRWLKPAVARLLGVAHGLIGLLGVVGAGVALLLAPKDWPWAHLVVVLPVGAALLAVAGGLAWRGRFRPLVPLLATAVAVLCLGHYSLVSRWDHRLGFREFGRRAAEMIPADEPVYHWRDPHFKTVFQLRRQIPDIRWQFQRAAPRDGESTIMKRLIAWLAHDRARAPWIVAHGQLRDPPAANGPESRDPAQVLPGLGYRQVLAVDVQEDLFGQLVLYRRSATPPARRSAVDGSP